MENTYNASMLAEVKTRVPLLYPYGWACYHKPNALFGDEFNMISSRGVQQGDVCGPVLPSHCSVVLQLQEFFLKFQVWYLDDGHLFMTVENVGRAMEQLKQSLPSLGLELNLAKCKVFGPNAHSAVHPGLADIPRVTFADGIVVFRLHVELMKPAASPFPLGGA